MKLPNALDFVKKMQMDIREAPFESAEQVQAQNIVSEVWCKQIIEALKKQIPEKPYVESDGDADGYPVWDYYCPSCNEYFDGYEPKHCWKCGQAIDWSEV